MSVTYEVWNLGRSKWKGEIVSQSQEPEHVEGALMRIANKHLMSRDIDFDGDVFSGGRSQTWEVDQIIEKALAQYRKAIKP